MAKLSAAGSSLEAARIARGPCDRHEPGTDHQVTFSAVQTYRNHTPREPPRALDTRWISAWRARLEVIGFREAVAAASLGVDSLDHVSLDSLPMHEEAARRRRDPAGVVAAVFLAHVPVTRRAVDRALTSSIAEWLCDVGVLVDSGGEVSSCFDLYPCDGAFFLTDVRFPLVAPTPAPAHPVMFLGGDSYTLAYLAPSPRRDDLVLDLCTGSGVQAILAARRACRVIGVDLNPRAIAMSRFNAALNGVSDRVELRLGDLYDVVGSERFALMLANPPFVATAGLVTKPLLYRDGGAAGDEVIARIVRGLAHHLAPTGLACIVAVFARRRGSRDLAAKVPRWLGRRFPATQLLLSLGEVTAEVQSGVCRRTFDENPDVYRARYRGWLEGFARLGIDRFTFGVLALRGAEQPSAFHTVDANPPGSPDRTIVQRVLDAYRDDPRRARRRPPSTSPT